MSYRVPTATYRVQLRSGFGFDQVRELASYFESLGVSDVYLSPLFQSRQDSSHGYDVVDHSTIEPEFGDYSSFEKMAQELRRRRMGVLLDLVPNHMGINDPSNLWWSDVLENGEASRHANHFDIDWDSSAENLKQKVLLPILGDHFGRELERGQLRVAYSEGGFQVRYYKSRFPMSPATWATLLARAQEHLGPPDDSSDGTELASIRGQLEEMPSPFDRSHAAMAARYQVKEVARQRIHDLYRRSPGFQRAVEQAVEDINGSPDHPSSFDELEALLDQQYYRLAFWRTAADEINYRRFFDINDLAAIRVEDPDVFAAVHDLTGRLLREGLVTGLRIDHPDGLLEPQKYFNDLQRLYQQSVDGPSESMLYVVVEKILAPGEGLPQDWAVAGETGYDLLNDLLRLQVSAEGLEALYMNYGSLCGIYQSAKEVVYQSKKQILSEVMSSELRTLAARLHRLSQRHRMSRDFTFPALLRALGEVIASFPVYRTYVPSQGWEVQDSDFAHIMAAVRWAKIRNPTMDWTTLDFIASVLLLQYPVDVDDADRELFRNFVLRFQQITGPIAAKGIEDTALYRYVPLAAFNEVGGEPEVEPLTAEEFHRLMQHRMIDWPNSLSATATHDTKRGEDVRARLLVLSEVADDWIAAVKRWRGINQSQLRDVGGSRVPSLNEEYFIYQTLVGTWPTKASESEWQVYRDRITEYLQKAFREAKVNTSWTNPAEEYEAAVSDFTTDILDQVKSPSFMGEMTEFVSRILDASVVNSLTQLLLKCTVPGAPDFYQGTELWDLRLVDPDNRRPVDFNERRQHLERIKSRWAESPQLLLSDLLKDIRDPQIKLFVTWRALSTRRDFIEVFQQGEYLPLSSSGSLGEHVVSFARHYEGQWVFVAATLRSAGRLRSADAPEIGDSNGLIMDWGDTAVELPPEAPHKWRCAFSNEVVDTEADQGKAGVWRPKQTMSSLPICLLVGSDA